MKAASDVYIPVDGEIIAFNGDLDTNRRRSIAIHMGNWLFKVKPAAGCNARWVDGCGGV